MKFSVSLVLSLAAAFVPHFAIAQESTRMLIGAPAGGGTDALFRSLARQMAEKTGTSVVPINMPAAGGSLTIEQMMRSPANGRTIAAVANSSLTSSPHLIKVPFTPQDYLPLLQVSAASYTMCVGPTFPATDASQFLAAFRAQPGKYTVGTDPGIGQLGAARIFKALGVDARLIPFKGASEIVTSFLGGHVDVYQGSIPAILPHVATGKARCLLVTGVDRSPRLPEAASLTDMGIPGEATTLTRLILVNKDTPGAIQQQLLLALERAARSEETRALLEAAGDTFVIVKGEPLGRNLKIEYEALGSVATRLGLTP
jgi:tripartite-type tricarboxylate transporter receptor subunit TctC